MVQIIHLNKKYNQIAANVNYQTHLLFRLPEGPLPYPRKSATIFNTESAVEAANSYLKKKKNKLDKNLVHNRAKFLYISPFSITRFLSLSLSLFYVPSVILVQTGWL